MNTFDRIDLLLKENKKKQIDLTNYLGVPKSHYTDWKTGRTASYNKYLPKIADFFQVSIDYLMGKTERLTTEYSDELTEQEKILLNSFRATTEEGKQRMIQSILNIYDEFEKKDTTTNTKYSS